MSLRNIATYTKNFLTNIHYRRHGRDLVRTLILLGVGGLALLNTAEGSVVLFGLAIAIFTSGVAHIIRRLFFPYLDLKRYFDEAAKTPQSAAEVIKSVVWLSVAVMVTVALLLR